MSDVRLFTVRPLSKQPRSDLRDSFRVYLSSSSLAFLKLRAGDICSLQPEHGPAKTAIAWMAAENLQSTVVQTSRTLQECYAIRVGEKISISRVDGSVEDIDSISLVECTDQDRFERYGSLSSVDRSHWAWSLELPLSKCEFVTPGLAFELELKGQRRCFKVASIRCLDRNARYTLSRFTGNSKVLIGDGVEDAEESPDTNLQVQFSGLGGMARQIDEINESLADFNLKQQGPAMPAFYEHSRGILLYGPKGTGKTALLRHIEAAGWRNTFSIGPSTFSRNANDGESKLRHAFKEAARSQPSVILIDQLEAIAPKRSSLESPSMASVLCESLDLVKDAHVLVVAATRHPNDVDDALRTPHRLAIEIELQVPTAKDRAEILRAIRGCSPEPNDGLLEIIAEKTHGYVGADLFALIQLVCRKARRRQMDGCGLMNGCDIRQSAQNGGQDTEEKVPLDIQEVDVLSALQEVRPTAMREVFLETPKVRWSDIGGQHEVKRDLQKAVERPLKVSIDSQSQQVSRLTGRLVPGTNEESQRKEQERNPALRATGLLQDAHS